MDVNKRFALHGLSLGRKKYIEIEKNVFCPKLADGKKSLSGDVYVLRTKFVDGKKFPSRFFSVLIRPHQKQNIDLKLELVLISKQSFLP